jgi:hypothetical protein
LLIKKYFYPNINKISNLVLNILFSLITYRTFFSGKLIGEPFDTRLQLLLHEHWWRWFQGLTEFRDTEFFYPYAKAFGFSDTFLLQGLIHSLLRYFGFQMENAWIVTTFGLLFIGNLGWSFLALKLLKNKFLQIIFALTMISSVSFVIHFTSQPNMVGYTFLSWFLYGFMHLKNSKKNTIKYQLALHIFLISCLVYALSCWYGLFFLTLTGVVYFSLSLLGKNFRISILSSLKNSYSFVNKKILLVFMPVYTVLVFIFIFVYISVQGNPSRPVDELNVSLHRVFNIPNGAAFNGTKMNGSVFSVIYENLNSATESETQVGIGLVSAILIVLLFIVSSIYRLLSFNQFKMLISALIVYVYFADLGGNFSIHSLFFNWFPGFQTIRFPYRYVIVLGFIVLIAIFLALDNINKNFKSNLSLLVTSLLATLLFIDQQRNSFIGWERDTLVNPDLVAQQELIEDNCDYFYYSKPGGGWWYNQIEAMVFAYRSGVPTVNGYSGGFPKGYPVESFTSSEDPNEIFDWIEKIDQRKRGCFTTGVSEIYPLNQKVTKVNLVGFESIYEIKSTSAARSPYPYFYIYSNENKPLTISFNLLPPKCLAEQNISVRILPDLLLYDGLIQNSGKDFQIEVDLRESRVKRVQFISDEIGCKVFDDFTQFFELEYFILN